MKYSKFLVLALSAIVLHSCTKDLDRTPTYGLTTDDLYATEAGYKQALAKIYAGLALTGNNGPAGSGDIAGIDEGFSSYLRQYWSLQELSTDEAVIAWNDLTIKDFHDMDWTASDIFNQALYSRIFYQITLANAYLQEAADDKISSRGFSGADAENIRLYRSEARFLRALSYFHALDLFGNPTFVTENDPIGAFLPPQIKSTNLFEFIESECKALESALLSPKQNEYARVDQAGLWMLMANLYLNAETYTGTSRYTDAVTYSKKVIDAGYQLDANYGDLFLADNHTSGEIIFPVAFDGNNSRTWGGTTFLVHAPVGGDMNVNDFGIDFGWGGVRTTSAIVEKFPDPTGLSDERAKFQEEGQNLEINDIGEFRDGYSIRKWKNITSTGQQGSNITWVDTDFPLFRLAEAYLIYAEAVLRGGSGGTNADALLYVNYLRERAYNGISGNLSSLTLQVVLDERARELHWEGKRRTDLIRYNQFTTSTYLWPWKGGVKDGRPVETFRRLFPIPAAEINTNPNLKQNPGY